MIESQVVPVHAVVEGDSTIDAAGRAHRITHIKLQRVRGSAPMLWIQRDDRPRFWTPWTFLDEEVTIIPSIAARQPQEAFA